MNTVIDPAVGPVRCNPVFLLVSFLPVLLGGIALVWPDYAAAVDYAAKKSGAWSNPSSWRPRGVPGAGDRIVGIGRHRITLAGNAVLGDVAKTLDVSDGDARPAEAAVVLDGAGQLILAPDAHLKLHGHLSMTGEGAQLVLGAAAKLAFAPQAEQTLQLQMFAANQRIEFAGEEAKRAEIRRSADSAGHWFFASLGHRDSVLAGRYGRISGALDPETAKGWTMYLANSRQSSVLAASNIEFVHCGQIGVFGLDAGENTKVDINGWTFRDSHPAARDVPALWFDGYGDVVVKAPRNKTIKRIKNLVSDKEVYVRYAQDYSFENWVVGANGRPGSVRAGNNGGNALVQRDLFQVVRDSGGVGLVADTTENVYMYAEADNPHGFDSRHLRGDAVLRNFWFESHFENQSDTGDAVLTNGPQSWVAEHQGAPVTLTIEHSGSIGDTSAKPTHPVFLTLNNAEGMRFRLRHNFMRQPVRFNSVALDENGETPAGTGLEFSNNLVFSPVAVEGYALGSAAGKQVTQRDAFSGINNNLYFNLRPRAGGYPEGHHALLSSEDIDQNVWLLDPELRDTSRNLSQWDLLLGGPGTARHAISEMQKMNDDEGFNPAYRLSGLIAFVRSGFAPTNSKLLDERLFPKVGPALAPVVQP